MKQLDTTQLLIMAREAYNDFVFTWVVARHANVDVKEHRALVEKTASEVKHCDEVFAKIEKAVAGVKSDDAIIVRQTIQEFRNGTQEFKNLYGKEEEPNA